MQIIDLEENEIAEQNAQATQSSIRDLLDCTAADNAGISLLELQRAVAILDGGDDE